MENKFEMPACVEMKLSQSDIIDYVINKEVEKLTPSIKKIDAEILELREGSNVEKILIDYAKNKFSAVFDLLNPVVIGVCPSTIELDYRTQDLMIEFMRAPRPLRMPSDELFQYRQESELMLVTDKMILKFEVPTGIKEQCKEIIQKIKSLYTERENINNQIHDIKNGSKKIKGNLVQQILSSSEDGQKLLDQLNSIDLTATSKLLE